MATDFTRLTILGLTVIDFSSSVGWNDSESSVTINLAPEDGQTISPYSLGEPLEFKMGSFKFNGFLDRVIEKHNGSGFTYEIKLNDGKDLIRNVECITSLYGTSDPVEDAPIINLFNVFRYHESKAFGSSQTNDTGMPYQKFEEAVNALSIRYGIISAGIAYSIQLNFSSQLPSYYRVDVPNINLMDLISKVCDDLGLLYRIELDSVLKVFTIKTTSLANNAANQKVNDVIKDLAKNKDVISWDAGVEATNNIDSNFMLWGGQKEHTFGFDCSKDGRIKQFLGYDIDGTPYWVSTKYKELTTYSCPNIAYPALSFIDFEKKSHAAAPGYFCFPIRGIEDIITSDGGLFITLDIAQVSIILGGQQDLWELYLEIRQDQGVSEYYQQIFLKPPRLFIAQVANFMHFGGSDEYPVTREFGEKENDVGVIRGTRVFSYLKQSLESYLGKSFMLPVNYNGALTSDYNINSSDPRSKTDGLLAGKQKLEYYTDEDALTPSQSIDYNVNLDISYVWIQPSTGAARTSKVSLSTSTLSQTQYNQLFSGPTKYQYNGDRLTYYTSAGAEITSFSLPYSSFNTPVPFPGGTMGAGSQLGVSLKSASVTETPKRIYNIVPTDTGWTEPALLDAIINSNTPKEYIYGYLLDANGKTNNYMTFTKFSGNFIFENSEETFLVGDILWVKCSVNSEYAIIDGQEHLSVTTTNAVTIYDQSIVNEVGYFNLTNCFFGIRDKNSVLGQSMAVKTGLLPLSPSGLLVNFKSTRNDFYGPWYFGNTTGGKTVVQKDDSLVPWTFNSSSILETAASGKLKDIVPIPYMETGTLTKVGLPEHSLGDEIVANGPILTSLSCTYGSSGITTQYSFRTFTPKFGLPSRYLTERLKKTALKAYSDRKNLLALYNESLKKIQAVNRRRAGFAISSFFLDYLGRRNDRNTPHTNIIMAQIAGRYGPIKTIGATLSNRETNAAIHSQSGKYFNKGGVSLDGLFSPFNNFYNGMLSSSTLQPIGAFQQSDQFIPTSFTYTPFRSGSYIANMVSAGGSWAMNDAVGAQNGVLGGQPIGLRGPIMVSGWGTDLFTKQIVPNQNAYMTAAALAGPVDLMWDSARGVWTSHDIFLGQAASNIQSYNLGQADENYPTGNVALKTSSGGSSTNAAIIQVKNIGKAIPVGSPVVAKYSVYDGNWYVEGQGCGIRYSEAECGDIITDESDSDFKITKNNSGDVGTCTDFLCHDFLETNGFNGTHTALTSADGATITATFRNGLLKKVEETPAPPPPPTPPPPPEYKWYQYSNYYGCYECYSFPVGQEDAGSITDPYDSQEQCQIAADAHNNSGDYPQCGISYCLDTDTSEMPPKGPDCRLCMPYYQGCLGLVYTGNNAEARCAAEQATHNEINCTTPAPTTPPPDCVQVPNSWTITCAEDGSISAEPASYIGVLGCGFALTASPTPSPSPYMSDFSTQLMKIEIQSLKQQLSNIYAVLQKHGIKIDE